MVPLHTLLALPAPLLRGRCAPGAAAAGAASLVMVERRLPANTAAECHSQHLAQPL
jgi:hypothetical protein